MTRRSRSGRLGELADDAQRVVEVAVHRHHPGAGGLRLEQLAGRDLAPRQDDHDLDAGRCAVGGRGRRRVAGRGADDGLRALLDGLGDGHDHASVLERAGRALALDLEVEERHADGATERPGMHEWGEALAEPERRSGQGDGQEVREALHEARPAPARGLLALQLLQHLAHAQGQASASTG